MDRVYNGEYIPTNHIVPEGNPGYNAQLVGPDGTQSVTGNQTKAQQLLQQAQSNCKGPALTLPDYCPYIDNGANSLPIKLLVNVEDIPSNKEVAQIATADWSQVLNLNVTTTQVSDLTAVIDILFPTSGGGNTTQAWLIGWVADYPDPQDWLSLQFYSNAQDNISYVDDPNLDQLMDQADQDQNLTRRLNEYHTIEQDVVNLCAWIPIDQEKTSWRLRPWVQGFGLNQVLTMEDVDWPNVYIQAH